MAFPPGITVVRATPENEGGKGVRTPVHLSLLSCRTSGKNQGVALTTRTPPVRRAVAPGGRGTGEAQARTAFPQRAPGIRANPPPTRLSRHSPDHAGEGSAL